MGHITKFSQINLSKSHNKRKKKPRRNNKNKNKLSQNKGNPTGDLEKEEISCERIVISSVKVVIRLLPSNMLFKLIIFSIFDDTAVVLAFNSICNDVKTTKKEAVNLNKVLSLSPHNILHTLLTPHFHYSSLLPSLQSTSPLVLYLDDEVA